MRKDYWDPMMEMERRYRCGDIIERQKCYKNSKCEFIFIPR